jgi:hypothetical protein
LHDDGDLYGAAGSQDGDDDCPRTIVAEDEDDRQHVPDVDGMNAAMNDFLTGIEQGLGDNYKNLAKVLQDVPIPKVLLLHPMTVAVAIAAGFIPAQDEGAALLFTPSELMLYKHASVHKWTVKELKEVIAMLKSPEFNSADVDTNLSDRMNAAIKDKRLKCHKMTESADDGDQDLDFWLRDLEDVLRELISDERLAGHQHFHFEVTKDSDGERVFGPSNGAMSFQIAQARVGWNCVPLSIVIYIDGSYIKKNIPVKPIFCYYPLLFCFFSDLRL